ncbi:MAG: hypothetical protein ACM3TN_16270 [Alphaproteobacteria bacterium]
MESRQRKGGKRGRRKSKEFMDAGREAFIRHTALGKWREMEDIRETLGFDWPSAAREAAQFLGRGPYQLLWVRRWQEQVLPQAAESDPGKLFAAVEGAIAAALLDEEKERKNRGDRPLDEEAEYKEFIDASMERLFQEQAGELEPNDNDW